MTQTEIDEILNTIKSENAMNSEMYNNALAEINTKLDDIANDGITTDLINGNLKELEISLESRHRFIAEKFSELREACENLNNNQELLTKNADFKIMFNILNEHIDNFAQEVNQQKNFIQDLETKLDDFRNDNSKKDEIISNVSVVKEGVDAITRGLEASIMDVNSTLRGITKTLMTMDVTDQNDIIKRELENIYLATNAILSSLEILDQKNDDIAKNQISKDDLVNLAGKIDNSFALVSEKVDTLDKSEKILSEIEKNRNELLNFNENITKGLSDYLNSVRDVLSNCIEEIKSAQTQTSEDGSYIPLQKLENLEKLSDDIKKIDTTVSAQSENYLTFINAKISELGNTLETFKSEISDKNTKTSESFNLKIQELSDIVKKFPEVLEDRFLTLQDKIDSSIKTIESFAEESNIELGNSISDITDIKTEISTVLESINTLSTNQDLFSAHIDGKFGEILPEFQTNLNIFEEHFAKLKLDIEHSNLENRSVFSEILEQTSVDIKNLINSITGNNATADSIQELSDRIGSITGNLIDIKNTFTEISAKNVENILSAITSSEGKLDNFYNGINETFTYNLNNMQGALTSAIAENNQLIEDLNRHFMSLSEQNAGNILSSIESTSAKVDEINNNINSAFDGKLDGVEQTVQSIKDDTRLQIENLGERFTTISEQNAGNILSSIESTSAKVDEINNNINSAFDGKLDGVEQTVQSIKDDTRLQIENLGERFTTISEQNAGNILSSIESTSAKVDEINNNINSAFDGKLDGVEQTVQSIKDDTRLQIENLGERFTTISEQNAGNILSGINSTNLKIDMLGVDLSTEIDNSFEMVRDFISNTKDMKDQHSTQFETLSESIKKLETEFVHNSARFKNAIDEQFSSLENYISAIKECSSNGNTSEEIEKLAEKMLAIETALHDSGDLFSDNLMMVQNKVADYEKSVNYLAEQTNQKLESTLSEISSIKDDFIKISELFSNPENNLTEISNTLKQQFNEISIGIGEIKENPNSSIEEQLQKNLAVVEEKFAILQELLNENNLNNYDRLGDLDENINGKISDLKQEISLVRTDISEIVNAKTASIAEEFNPLKEAIDNFVNTGFDSILENLRSQIELSYLNFSSDVNESLTENHDNYLQLNDAYKDLTAKFTKVEEVINDLNQNQIGVMTSTITTIEQNIANNFDKTNELLENWKTDLKKLEEKTDSGFMATERTLDSILKHLNSLSHNSNLKELKEEFLSKFDYFDSEVTSKLKVINDELDNGNQTSSAALKKLQQLLDEVNSKVDVLALSDSSERIEDLMQSLQEKIDILAAYGEKEKVEEMLNALHDKVDVLVMSDSAEKLEKLEELEDIIKSLHDKVDILTFSDSEEHIEELVQSLHDKVDVLATSSGEGRIEELVQSLHDKVDVLALSEDNEVMNEIQSIKELIFEERKQFEKFGTTEKAQNVDKYLEKLLSDLSTVEERINGLDIDKNASDIKDSVMNALLSVADQITFAEETEEIKGFVEERTEEINKNLLDVKKQLSSIASSSDSWDYTYTMQDIESDIAKLRIILNDISTSSSKEDISEISQNMHKIAASVNSLHSSLTEEQILELKNNIEKINEDVLSLSSRTNKLLLTSDESYRALTDGLDEFSKVTNQLQKRIDILDNNSMNEVIEKKLDNINDAVTMSANADNIMRQVMMYLGEWIDDASEKLEIISADTSNLSVINSEICLLKSMVDNKEIVDSLERKFNEQQNKIDMLEQKLDTILNAINNTSVQNSTLEDKLNEKMKKLDDKINKLSKGIEKLTSYVDED